MGAARGGAPPGVPSIPGMQPLRPLGRGGFADVVLCRWAGGSLGSEAGGASGDGGDSRDAGDAPVCAVKALRPGAPEGRARAFRREIALLIELSGHPGLPTVLDSGVAADGRDWVALEHCPPPAVVDLLEAGPLPVERALEIVLGVAGAVAAIHGAGYAHRDIKPANILLDAMGAPVLIDLGIAAPLGASAGGGTAGGASPLWAPPEQQLGEGAVAPSADVYALGATLHTLLAGRSPHEAEGEGRAGAAGRWTGGDQLSVLNRVMHEPRPPIGRDDVPEALEALLSRALALNPADRPESMEAFTSALRPLAETGRYQGAGSGGECNTRCRGRV